MVSDNFAFKFSNWLSGIPGDAEKFLEESVNMGWPIVWATLAPREKIVARGVAPELWWVGKLRVASDITFAKQNRFEMWRLFHKECKRDTATRKVV